MKAKYPKSVWVLHHPGCDLNGAWTTKKYPVKHGYKLVRYHLHPGNEVKLKRENAWMRRWLRDLLTGEVGHFEMMAVIELRMPDLFTGGKKGK